MAVLLLDTTIASGLIKGHLLDRLSSYSTADLVISSITEAEIRYGLAKKPEATLLRRSAEDFLRTIRIETFDSGAARAYGELRSVWESRGFPVGSFDGLIAGHARALEATLVTRDKALLGLSWCIPVEQW